MCRGGDGTEGSGGVWERLTYVWSNPRRVEIETTDSNVWGGKSGYTYTLSPQIDGTTDVKVTIVREGKNLKGRLVGVVLGSVGKHLLTKAFTGSVQAIEARNAATAAVKIG